MLQRSVALKGFTTEKQKQHGLEYIKISCKDFTTEKQKQHSLEYIKISCNVSIIKWVCVSNVNLEESRIFF